MAGKGKSGTPKGSHRGKRSTRASGSRAAQKKAAGQSLISKAVSAILKPARAARPPPKPKAKPSRDTGPNWLQRIAASLSPAYRRRLERGAAQGKTRQQSRGHKEKEHVKRKKDEESQAKATGKLTTPQRAAIRMFVKEQATKAQVALGGADPDDVWDDYKPYFEKKGYAWFLHLKEIQSDLHRQWIDAGRPWGDKHAGGGKIVGFLSDLTSMAERTEAEGWMMFYH